MYIDVRARCILTCSTITTDIDNDSAGRLSFCMHHIDVPVAGGGCVHVHDEFVDTRLVRGV